MKNHRRYRTYHDDLIDARAIQTYISRFKNQTQTPVVKTNNVYVAETETRYDL